MPKSSIARLDAERLQCLELLARCRDVVEQHALGELEGQARRFEARRPKHALDRRRRDRAPRAGAPRRSRSPSSAPSRCRRRPTRTSWRHAASSTNSPIGTMRPVCSARLMNSIGSIMPRSQWRQRTSASKPRGVERRELDDRLVVHLHLAALERVAQVGDQRGALDDLAVHVGFEQLGSAPCRRSSRSTSRCRRCA